MNILHRLMAKGRIGDGEHHPWASRDYPELACRAVGCLFNIVDKCAVPSHCKIMADGRCEGFKPRPLPPKLDGD